MLFLLVIGLAVGIVGSWFIYRRGRNRGVGEALYDGPYKQRLSRPLVSWEYGITGKPDYVVEHDGAPVPVLVKNGRAPKNSPHDSHVAQVLVYCLLIHESAKVAPPYGIIRYADRTFEVDYNEPSVQALLDLLDDMHSQRHKIPARSHDKTQHCFACLHQGHCEQSLLHSAPRKTR